MNVIPDFDAKVAKLGTCGRSGLSPGSKARVGDRPVGCSIESRWATRRRAALQLGLGRSVVYDLLKRYRQRSQTSLPVKRIKR
jgi:hypothetical protein